jgi:hypothetical protein
MSSGFEKFRQRDTNNSSDHSLRESKRFDSNRWSSTGSRSFAESSTAGQGSTRHSFAQDRTRSSRSFSRERLSELRAELMEISSREETTKEEESDVLDDSKILRRSNERKKIVFSSINDEGYDPLKAGSSSSTLSLSTLRGETTSREEITEEDETDVIDDGEMLRRFNQLKKKIFSSINDKSYDPLEVGSSSSTSSLSTLSGEDTSEEVGHSLTDHFTGDWSPSWAKTQSMFSTEFTEYDEDFQKQYKNNKWENKQFRQSLNEYKNSENSIDMLRNLKNNVINSFNSAVFNIRNRMNRILTRKSNDIPMFDVQWEYCESKSANVRKSRMRKKPKDTASVILTQKMLLRRRYRYSICNPLLEKGAYP